MHVLTPKHGYAVQVTEQHRTTRGVMWVGVITHRGVPIGQCENRGDGGQTTVRINNPIERAGYNAQASIACPRSPEAPSRFAELLADPA